MNFINLQYGDTATELDELYEQQNIRIHDWDDADPLKNLDDFAAQISALDLVISVDNSTVHFSGALGVPTNVMLSFESDWRWRTYESNCYWYGDSMQIIRQQQDGEWNDVVEKTAASLQHFIEHNS